MAEFRIIIADGHFLVRKGLKAIVKENKGLRIIDEAENVEDLAIKVEQYKPDIVTIDISEPYFPLEDITRIIAQNNQTKFIAISASMGKQTVLGCIDAGIHGYLLKECGEEEIVDAFMSSLKGEKFFCRKVLDLIIDRNDVPGLNTDDNCDPLELSDRETEILKHIAEGFTNKEIADLLFLSTHTIATHRKNIMHKLKISNTAGLVMYAVKENIISPN